MAVLAAKFGSGPEKVLLLHGWFGPAVFNEETLKEINNPTGDDRFEFALLHNPGYLSAKSDTNLPEDITALSNMIIAAADTLGWDKFHIIGHSYGGVAGLRMATLAPERILSIIGLCSVMPSGFDGTAAGNINADENTAPSLLAAYSQGVGALTPTLASFDSKLSEADLKILTDTALNDMTEDSYKAYFGVWTQCAFTEEAKGLATKTMFIVGKQDHACAMNYVQPTLDAMPNATAVQVEGGHFAPMSNTDGTLVTEINKFFAE